MHHVAPHPVLMTAALSPNRVVNEQGLLAVSRSLNAPLSSGAHVMPFRCRGPTASIPRLDNRKSFIEPPRYLNVSALRTTGKAVFDGRRFWHGL